MDYIVHYIHPKCLGHVSENAWQDALAKLQDEGETNAARMKKQLYR